MDSPATSSQPHSSHAPVCVVTGSSVAAGWYAENNHGWSQLLGDHLSSQGWKVFNVAKPGADARHTIERFSEHVASKSPTLVIIGLGLWNERINQRGYQACTNLLTGLLELISMCQAIGAHVILGGVYPNQRYTADLYEMVLKTHRELQTWKEKYGISVFDFLSNVDDGSGHWFPDMMSDFIHPNDLGHLTLYRNIDLSIFDALKTRPTPKARL